MTETRGVGFRSWFKGVENKSRKNARTVVHRLHTLLLFRWQASTSPRQVAGDRLGAAVGRESRANEGDAGTASAVCLGIVSSSLWCRMSIRCGLNLVIFPFDSVTLLRPPGELRKSHKLYSCRSSEGPNGWPVCIYLASNY